jgi:ketosteroid isomerase-like protein
VVSEENVAIVLRIYDEINARLEFPREWFDPDCVTDWTDVAPDGELIHGVDATNALIAPYFGTFENFHVAAEEIVYADQERVVVAIRDGGRMRGSDAEITSRYCHVWTFRDGKVVRLSSHIDKAGALKAVGLEG